MRRAFSDGYRYTASFDLTACYDSIDHTVLCHFLGLLRLDREFCDLLCYLLRHWTETSGRRRPVYHGHGIPQGPQPSGLLAEAVLRHFDDAPRPREVRYFRYVDDTRLFAKSEEALRYELVRLDVRSKEIGLFPQSSKIDIHRVRRIEDEFKGISHPQEPSSFDPTIRPQVIQRRLVELSPRLHVPNPTRFKYVLGGAPTNAPLAKRLLRILRNEPHLYDSVFRYFERCPRLSKAVSEKALGLLQEYELYPAFSAGLIRAIQLNLHVSQRQHLYRYCRRRLSGSQASNDPELRAIAAGVIIRDGVATWAQTRYHLTWKRSWWVRCYLIPLVSEAVVGPSSVAEIVNRCLRDTCADVALVAAERTIVGKIAVHRPVTDVHEWAQIALRRAGRIGRISARTCPIRSATNVVLGPQVRDIRWPSMFSKVRYRQLVSRITVWRAYALTDPTAWISLSDTINDILLDTLFAHDPTIGQYTLGSIGSVLNAGSRFAQKYPLMFKAAEFIHRLRLTADLVHPITKSTQLPTRRIRFAELRNPQRLLAAGWSEIWQKW